MAIDLAGEGSMVSHPAIQSGGAGSTPATRSTLVVAPCSMQAARYAVEHWHYTKVLPGFRLVRFGVWEDDRFVGAIIYSRGASPQLGKPYGLTNAECVELVRVAFRPHEHPVSASVARSLKLLKASSPGLRLVMSFADSEQNHVGTIYQAGNWLYLGTTKGGQTYIINGKKYLANALNRKRLRGRLGAIPADTTVEWARKALDPNLKVLDSSRKHRYAYPFDRAMRRRLEPISLPYPTGPANE